MGLGPRGKQRLCENPVAGFSGRAFGPPAPGGLALRLPLGSRGVSAFCRLFGMLGVSIRSSLEPGFARCSPAGMPA